MLARSVFISLFLSVAWALLTPQEAIDALASKYYSASIDAKDISAFVFISTYLQVGDNKTFVSLGDKSLPLEDDVSDADLDHAGTWFKQNLANYDPKASYYQVTKDILSGAPLEKLEVSKVTDTFEDFTINDDDLDKRALCLDITCGSQTLCDIRVGCICLGEVGVKNGGCKR